MSKKILLISDSPYATTGLGRMARYFITMFPEFEWVFWGVNHPSHETTHTRVSPVYNPEDFNSNFKIISPSRFQDPNDPTYSFSALEPVIKQEKPDYIITSIDYNRIAGHFELLLRLKMMLGFKWVNYFPVDREFFFHHELPGLKYPDINVCISKFGVKKIHKFDKKLDIKQIYHPVDRKEFPFIDNAEKKEFREKFYKGAVNEDTFLVGTVNRNFARKDPVRTLWSFIQFNKKYDNSMMYFHGNRVTYEGHDLAQVARQLEIKDKKLIFPPEGFFEVNGVNQQILNQIYRTFDLFVTSSMGEGFGFSTVEALLCEIPIIAPDNTSFPELIQDFGYLIPVKDWTFLYNNYDLPWPIVDKEKFVKKMKYVKENYSEAKEKAKAGKKWVEKNLSLNTIKEQWAQILKP